MNVSSHFMKQSILLTTIIICILCTRIIIPVSGSSPVEHVSLNEARNEIKSFFSSVGANDLVILMGSKLSIGDQIFFTIMKSQIHGIENENIYPDTFVDSVDQLNETYVVLLGSEKTNVLTNQLVTGEKINISKTLIAPPLVLVFGFENETGKNIVILYTLKEKYNNINKAAERSPLNLILDTKYVPIVATAASMIFLYIWNTLGMTAVELASDYTSESIIERIVISRRAKKKKMDTLTHRKFIDVKEGIAVLFSAIVFSIAMSWTWSNELTDFMEMLFINLVIISFILLLRESARQYFCYRHKVKAEHVFWPLGALLTLISTILGNTFSLASYTVKDEKNEIEKQFGKITFFISVILFLFVLLTFVWNLFYPSLLLQMVFTYTIMMLFIDLFPLSPMDGHDIKKWNFPIWLIFYSIIIISYICINFTFLF